MPFGRVRSGRLRAKRYTLRVSRNSCPSGGCAPAGSAQKGILSEDKEQRLKDITHKGKSFSAKEILHANILLLTNENVQKKRYNQEIADLFGISKTTVNQVRKTYAVHGIDAALSPPPKLRVFCIYFIIVFSKKLPYIKVNLKNDRFIPTNFPSVFVVIKHIKGVKKRPWESTGETKHWLL